MYIVEYFAMIGCDMNSTMGANKGTPIMQACKYGQLEMVKYLVEHGADPMIRDTTGISPIRVSMLNKHSDVTGYLQDLTKELKEKKKSAESKKIKLDTAATTNDSTVKPASDFSSFSSLFACISGMDANPTASQLFAPPLDDDIEEGSNEDSYEDSQDDESDHMSYRSESKHSKASESTSGSRKLQPSKAEPSAFALHSACRTGASLGLIAVLAMPAKDIDTLDDEGHTALYIACALCHWDIAVFLIEKGANPAIYCDSVGETPLHVICHSNSIGVLRKTLDLREQGRVLQNINLDKIVDVNNSNLLHAAVLGDALEVVCILIDETELDVDGTAVGKRTPLHLACIHGFSRCASALIERDADISVSDAVGGTALLYAVKSNTIEPVEALLSHGADLKCKTETGNTVMHIACQTGNLEMAMFLLNKGASLLERNSQGKTPYSYAVKCEHQGVMKWIASVDRKATL